MSRLTITWPESRYRALEEAAARRRKTIGQLIDELTIDGCQLPMPFDQIQCADLNGWSGDVDAPGSRKVVASSAELVGCEQPPAAPSMTPPRRDTEGSDTEGSDPSVSLRVPSVSRPRR